MSPIIREISYLPEECNSSNGIFLSLSLVEEFIESKRNMNVFFFERRNCAIGRFVLAIYPCLIDPISALFLPRLQNKNSAFDTRFEHRHYDHSIQSKAELNLAVERFFCIVFPEKKNFVKESQWKIVT